MKDWFLNTLARFAACALIAWTPQMSGAEELAAPPKVKPLDGAAVIEGVIEAHPECARGELEAWLSQGSMLLYQVDVAQRATFEFHVLPGHYNLIITGSGGCFSETRIEVGANRTELVTVSPVPTVRSERRAASLLDWFVLPSFMAPPPWWAYFGGLAYPNRATWRSANRRFISTEEKAP